MAGFMALFGVAQTSTNPIILITLMAISAIMVVLSFLYIGYTIYKLFVSK